MADDIREPITTQSTTSSIPPNTHRSTSAFADTPTHHEHAVVAGPERPRSQDLPPSYGSALVDARNSRTAIGTGPIEAHRIDIDGWLSDNEWQNDPSMLEYLTRGRGIELPPAREEGQVSHDGSQIVIVRRGNIMAVSTSPPPRNASTVQDVPQSLPVAQSRATFERGEERPARGPFGRVGRRMGSWGQQIGRQAGAIGHQFGQRTEGWASAYSAGGGGYNPPVRPTRAIRPSTAEPSGPPQYEHPPSYNDARADH